jgi:hypothetical protein
MKPGKAILIVGSPRGDKSASRALGRRLLDGLAARGVPGEIFTVQGAWASEVKMKALLAGLDSAGLIVFAFPLYVDHLPAPLIRLLELIATRKRLAGPADADRPLVAAIVQCGFPERRQNLPAVDIMRRFADLAGYTWAGGLAMGMGGAAGSRMPDKPKGMLRNVLRALDQAAAALAEGKPIPEETVEAFGRRLMPPWMYFTVANFNWKREARKLGRGRELYARPYAE